MEHLLSEPIFNAWWKFLLEATLARQHQKVNFEHIQGSSPNPILDSLLPSLLTLRAVTILDEAMQVYIEHHGPSRRSLTSRRSPVGSIILATRNGLRTRPISTTSMSGETP